VISTTLPASSEPQPQVVPDDPVGLVRRLKRQPGAGVWLAGGGRLAGALLEEIDELVIKRYPVVLGVGIPLTTGRAHLLSFELVDDRTLRSGTTVTTYSSVSRTCSSRA
jgi:dihydrofolate reductase